ncbi:TetR/AcrR family transcriptional regulator [Dietzia sp. PP-33]|uniref:TetR/AcrR family transcriptional regulator n=1 Tax=Dietzia sp. PP-33 TaxID=2957500 RepID=UPI0029BA8BAF|nr:TetR/AcrR family transcriptional regulator [Dietzia sp. PP-33]MDX2358905.1 TetR/AcrR family transcriptional regulator [Dietzia sp. PP-33]
MAPVGRPRAFEPETALDAAVETFWRHGYDAAGLAELTEAMGISRPALYRAFGDKAQLFRAALERYIARNMEYVEAALAEPTAREVAEAFLVGNAAAVTSPGQPPGCLSVQAMVTDQADAFSLLAENRRVIQGRLADRFRCAIRDGDLPSDEDAEELARFLITLATGFAIRAADGEPRHALVALAHRSVAVVPSPDSTPHPNSAPDHLRKA